MSSILDIILEYAQKNNAKKIHRVNLKIGVMSDVIPDWAQTYFDMLTKDTIADGAKLVVEKVPLRIRCNACGHEYELEHGNWNFACHQCKSTEIEILSGRELSITSIEID